MRTGMNSLFSAGDDVVLRVGRPTADPAAAVWLADQLTRRGIRVPRYARSQPMTIGALSVYAIFREHEVGSVDWAQVGRMVAVLHTVEPAEISPLYPTPWCSSFPWWQFDRLMADVGDRLDPASRRGIDAALARRSGWRDHVEQPVLCHGDVHPGNVLQTGDGPMLIDWDLLCIGPAAWDHGPLMTWTERWGGAPGVYEAFADGYGRSFRGDPVGEAIAELRLVAATLMRVRAGLTDPTAADEAERRLRWWRGDPDAHAWRPS
jgi:Ser/Thr protein kinase RdoA (MazF antagonist)